MAYTDLQKFRLSDGLFYTDIKERVTTKELIEFIGFKRKYKMFSDLFNLRISYLNLIRPYGVKNVIYTKSYNAYLFPNIYLSAEPFLKENFYIALNASAGFLAHEFGHFLFTKDKDKNLLKRVKNSVWSEIFNILEDERIEKLIIKEDFKLSMWLPYAKEYYFKHYTLEFTGDKLTDLINGLRALVRYPSAISENVYKKMPDWFEYLLSVLPKFSLDFHELMLIADEIMLELAKRLNINQSGQGFSQNIGRNSKEEQKEQSENNQKTTETGNKQKEQAGQKEQEKQNGQTEQSEDTTQENGKQGIEEVKQQLEQNEKQLQEVSDQLKNENIEQNSDLLPEDEKKEKIAAERTEILEELDYSNSEEKAVLHNILIDDTEVAETDLYKRFVHIVEENKGVNIEDYKKKKEQVLREIFVFRSAFMHRYKNNRKTVYGKFAGEFDDDLVRAFIGEKNVFKEQHEIKINGFVVILLIDLSASMDDYYNYVKAKIFSIMVYEALKNLPEIDLIIYGHSTTSFYESMTTIYEYYNSFKSRKTPYSILKMRPYYNGRHGSAVEYVAKDVRKYTKQPVLCFMVSDGEPYASLPRGWTDESWLKRGLEIAKQHDVDVIHVAIDKSAIMGKEYFDHEFIVDRVEDVAKIVTNIVKNKL